MTAATEASKPASIDALIAAYREAHDAFEATHAETLADEEVGEYKAAQDRYRAAWQALRDARPSRPRDLAKQVRWIVEQQDLWQKPLGEILDHVADCLEAPADPNAPDVPGLESAYFDLRGAVELMDRVTEPCFSEPETCRAFTRQVSYLMERTREHVGTLERVIYGDEGAPA